MHCFYTWLFDSPSFIARKLINVHCVTLSLWKQQHPVGGIQVHGCMDAWYEAIETYPVSEDESELNKFCLTAFVDFYSVKKLDISETSHLRDCGIIEPLTAR